MGTPSILACPEAGTQMGSEALGEAQDRRKWVGQGPKECRADKPQTEWQ